MAKSRPYKHREGRPLADLIGKAMEPACRKRGFATADLIASWPDIVGDRYADRTRPEALNWPRQSAGVNDDAVEPATLIVRTDGPTALYLQHEIPQVIERINMFFGWYAVGRIKIVQKPLAKQKRVERVVLRPLEKDEEERLHGTLGSVDNEKLHDALERLGRAVLAKRG